MATDNEPMSEERLAEIRSRYLTPVEIMRDTLSVPHAYEVDISRLLAEVDRLRALIDALADDKGRVFDDALRLQDANAAMREIVQAVDSSNGAYEDDAGWLHCIFCGGNEEDALAPEEHGLIAHTSDCPVTKARDLLATSSQE